MRLAISVALSVTAVLAVVALAGLRIGERQLDGDLRETARVTAVALADEIELHQEPLTSDTLVPLLGDFMSAAVDLHAIHVFEMKDSGLVALVSTTVLAPDPAPLARKAVATREPAWSDDGGLLATVAVPVYQDDRITGAVAVAVSLGAVAQFRRAVTLLALGGGIVAIAAITLLIHLLARRLILEPVNAVRTAIATAGRGDLSARVQVSGARELEEVASGLNAMLAELEDLHSSLTRRVATATEQLQQRNEQLVRSYENVLQLREAAARAQQLAAVGQTMANVAHQIGTPLNLVKGHVQLLQQEIVEPTSTRRLTIVEDQVDRVSTAVRELLERATPHADPKRVSVAAILRRLSEAVRIRLAAARVAVETDIGGGVPDVTADETQLELALLNLLINAVDAMPGGGRLALSARRDGANAVIEVRDTGVGVPAAVLPRIFDPWFTTKSPGHGTGLGLSVTRDVVTRLGGTIMANSEPGQGTTFTITLPAAADQSA
jgi:signal transduction histidine kinase